MAPRPFQQPITYPEPSRTGHFGRNGTMQGHGVCVEAWGGECHVTGIVSRGHRSGSARLSIPFDQLDPVITALIAVRDGTD